MIKGSLDNYLNYIGEPVEMRVGDHRERGVITGGQQRADSEFLFIVKMSAGHLQYPHKIFNHDAPPSGFHFVNSQEGKAINKNSPWYVHGNSK